ncbi:MAG: zinc ribbon domain-containing protein [Anaerolineales bacterium]|nr:zinc ribbon domain-containing protein [Anaerolineales bacterium]
MPIYTYHCANCGHEFDVRQGFEDNPLKICPECRKHSLQKVYKPAAVAFKGSGFYVTDKKKPSALPATKPSAPAAAEGKPSSAETSSAPAKETTAKEKTAGESKPAAKTE